MKKNSRKYFSDISILTLLVLVMSALYILYFVAEMKNSSELFLTVYTSVPREKKIIEMYDKDGWR